MTAVLGLLADEGFDNDILRGLLHRYPGLDVLRVQDVGLIGRPDPVILAWAASEGRIVLTHDVRTMVAHAYERIIRREPMPGMFVIRKQVPIGIAIEELLLMSLCSEMTEWDGQVTYLPL